MNNEVDYSSLPIQSAALSVWKTLRLSIFLSFLLIIIIGAPYYIGESRQNSHLLNIADDLVAYLEALAILAVPFIAYHTLTARLRAQCATMCLFAQQNNWKFEGRRRVNDSDALPTNWEFLGKSAHQVYCIQGNLHGKEFELYAIWGVDRTMFATQYGSVTLGYRTAVRTRAQLNSLSLSDDLQITRNGPWNYAIRNGNAITAVEINAMLQPPDSVNDNSSTTSPDLPPKLPI